MQEDPEFSSHAAAELSPGIGSFIGVPVTLSDGTFHGTLCAVDPKPRTLTRQQADLLAVLARFVATQIERQRVDEELRLRDRAIAASNNGIVITDPDLPDNAIVYANEGFVRTTGYGADEVLGRNCRFLQGQDRDQPELEELRTAIQEGRECRVVVRNYKKDGTPFLNELSVSSVYDETGKLINHIGIQNDVTERKRTEDKLRAAYLRHQEMIDSAEAIIWRGDARTLRFTFVSQQAEVILGYPAGLWVDEPAFWYEHIHPDDQKRALAFCKASTAEKRSHTFEYRMLAADGRIVWLRTSVSVLVEDGVATELVGVMTDVTERKVLEEQLRHRAFHDFLTGLPNRALFVDRIEHALARAGRDEKDLAVAVLYMDLDNFKVVNDSLGHEAGDRLLVETAERLLGCLRPMDTATRLGGDEFAVLLEGVADEAEAARVADRIGDALRSPFTLGPHEAHVDVSIGVALGRPSQFHAGLFVAEDLLRNADIAMYQAKVGGKARYRLFEASMNTRAARRLDAENRLRKGIRREEFRVHYQPTVSLGSGEVVGMEALVRWADPERGLIPPSEFIPLAEETGLIVSMGEWVMREACRQAAEWWRVRPGDAPVVVWVNLSPRQFHRADMVGQVSSVLKDTGLDPRCLGLEITEGVVMDDAESTIEILRQLKALGVRLAIDDFGKGYSSLGYVKRFPVDVLKIDHSFVEGIRENPEDLAIVQAVTTLGQSLGMRIVAEGVETVEQLDVLRGLGCDYGQGYHFARPMPGEEASAFLATHGDPR